MKMMISCGMADNLLSSLTLNEKPMTKSIIISWIMKIWASKNIKKIKNKSNNKTPSLKA